MRIGAGLCATISGVLARAARLPRLREAVALAAMLAAAVMLGAGISRLTAHYGPAKVLYLLAGAVLAVASVVSVRVGVLAVLVALTFPFRSSVLIGVEVHTSHVVALALGAGVLGRVATGRLRVPRGILAP